MLTGLALASSQTANHYLVMEQRVGVAKLVTRFSGIVQLVRSSEYIGVICHSKKIQKILTLDGKFGYYIPQLSSKIGLSHWKTSTSPGLIKVMGDNSLKSDV